MTYEPQHHRSPRWRAIDEMRTTMLHLGGKSVSDSTIDSWLAMLNEWTDGEIIGAVKRASRQEERFPSLAVFIRHLPPRTGTFSLPPVQPEHVQRFGVEFMELITMALRHEISLWDMFDAQEALVEQYAHQNPEEHDWDDALMNVRAGREAYRAWKGVTA